MFKKQFGVFYLLFLVAILSGCATKATTGLDLNHDEQQKLIVTPYDVRDVGQLSGDISDPKYLLASAISRWDQQSYREAGNLLLNAYKAGKAKGYQWQVSAKAELLTSALRAYFIVGAFEQARYTGSYLVEEMTVQEQSLLSQESKTLVYWATMGGGIPVFEKDVPGELRLSSFAQ